MYNSSVAQLLRSDIGKRIQANSFFVGTLVTVNPATRFASVYVSNEDDLLQNVVVLDDVNIANLNNGDIVLVLQLVGGLNVILGSLSTNTGRQVELDNFSGGLKVGTVNGFLPDAIEYITSYITGTSVIEEPIFDAYNEICGYNYSYSYEYELAAVTLGEDVYAGEIRRFSNDLYAWSSSYESAYSYYDNSYDLGAEWVKWDDARYIQGIPVVDKKPSDNDTLVFDNTIGMYRPGVVGCTLIASAVLTANATSVTFSNIPGIYTDLMLTGVARTDRASEDDNIAARFNDDSGNNYGWINPAFSGTPTGTASMTCYIGRGVERLLFARAEAASSTGGMFSGIGVIITQYSNTAVLKVTNSIASAKFGNADADADYKTGIYSGLWHSTNAITKITMFPHGGTNIVAGSRFYLWGLK